MLHFLSAHLHPYASEVDGKPTMHYANDLRVVFYLLLKEWMGDRARRHEYKGALLCNAIFQVAPKKVILVHPSV